MDVFIVTAMCKKCGAELEAINVPMVEFSPKREHQCPACRMTYVLDKAYPCTEYKRRWPV